MWSLITIRILKIWDGSYRQKVIVFSSNNCLWIIKGNADGRKLEPNQKETSSIWSHLQLYCWHAHSDRCGELDCLSNTCVYVCLCVYIHCILYILYIVVHIYVNIHKYEFQFNITSAWCTFVLLRQVWRTRHSIKYKYKHT